MVVDVTSVLAAAEIARVPVATTDEALPTVMVTMGVRVSDMTLM